jgi:6,7-dimethyl-8-ribityllumazine synthase
MTPGEKKAAIKLPGARILLVVAAYHSSIVEQLVKGAEAAIKEAGATVDRVDVPGAFELPAAIVYASHSHAYDGYVSLGCVVRGDTDHYDYICTETARGIMELTRDGFCVGFGVLTVHSLAQAEERADVARGDKGGEAAKACLTMISIKRRYKGALG